MRPATLLLVLVSACGASETKKSEAPPPDDHQLHRTESATGVKIVGKGVSLATLPTMDWFLLPASGEVDVDIDIKTPQGLPSATGSIAIACPKGCRIGDDTTKLKPTVKNPRAAAFTGDGMSFGHIELGAVNVKIDIANGTATIKTWELVSNDLEIKVTGSMELGKTISDSRIDGCIRFKVLPGLQQRDPKTAAVFQVTGAARGGDGYEHIRIEGPVSHLRYMARDCDDPTRLTDASDGATRGAPSMVPDPGDGAASAPPNKAPNPTLAETLATTFTKRSATTFDVDGVKLTELFVDPSAFAAGGRVVPAMKNGQPIGFKLYAIKPGSLYQHAGLENGDTVKTIAGFPLIDAAQALEAYTAISRSKPGDTISVEIDRKGAAMTLVYTLR